MHIRLEWSGVECIIYVRIYWVNLKPFLSPIGAMICFVTSDEGLIGGQ